MARIVVKSYQKPDETRPFVGHGRFDVLSFDGSTIGRGTFEPGWRWSTDVKPIVGTESCQAPHAGYCLAGRIRIRMDDGQEKEIAPGDAFEIEPGHDAWVVGNETCVLLDFAAAEHYAEATRDVKRPAEQGAPLH